LIEAIPIVVLSGLTPMNESLQTLVVMPPVLQVAAGQDQFGEYRGLGISSIHFKVTPQDVDDILIIENRFREKGGPARHLHYYQDEWFYPLEAGSSLR
jgi:hypothetical protein